MTLVLLNNRMLGFRQNEPDANLQNRQNEANLFTRGAIQKQAKRTHARRFAMVIQQITVACDWTAWRNLSCQRIAQPVRPEQATLITQQNRQNEAAAAQVFLLANHPNKAVAARRSQPAKTSNEATAGVR